MGGLVAVFSGKPRQAALDGRLQVPHGGDALADPGGRCLGILGGVCIARTQRAQECLCFGCVVCKERVVCREYGRISVELRRNVRIELELEVEPLFLAEQAVPAVAAADGFRAVLQRFIRPVRRCGVDGRKQLLGKGAAIRFERRLEQRL